MKLPFITKYVYNIIASRETIQWLFNIIELKLQSRKHIVYVHKWNFHNYEITNTRAQNKIVNTIC